MMINPLNAMVMAPALPNLRGRAYSDNNNPPPGQSKVDTGAEFSDHEQGIWNFLKRARTSHELTQTYRQFLNSPHCEVERNRLREMRDDLMRNFLESP